MKRIFQQSAFAIFAFLAFFPVRNIIAQSETKASGFKKITLTTDFISEGVAAADLNKDGKIDIIAGYNWFEAPKWTKHTFAPMRVFDPKKEYSNSFLNLGMDVNLDGWDDVVIIDFPGLPAFWFENPGKSKRGWVKHMIAGSVGITNESPGFIDVDTDGRLDILCGDKDTKQIIWLKAPVVKGDTTWQRFALSAPNVPGTEDFSHGIGMGDINMDGIRDVVVREGWFEGTKNLDKGDRKFHPSNIGAACSHMQVVDVNKDGKNDVISASAHALGIWWHEQVKADDGSINFVTHLISEKTAQTHSSIMADLNGDGQNEYITGKRFLAHHGRDPGDNAVAYLLWYEITPGIAPYFKEHVIDDDSGAGLNITVKDMDGDKKTDIIIANKKGVFLFINQMEVKF